MTQNAIPQSPSPAAGAPATMPADVVGGETPLPAPSNLPAVGAGVPFADADAAAAVPDALDPSKGAAAPGVDENAPGFVKTPSAS